MSSPGSGLLPGNWTTAPTDTLDLGFLPPPRSQVQEFNALKLSAYPTALVCTGDPMPRLAGPHAASMACSQASSLHRLLDSTQHQMDPPKKQTHRLNNHNYYVLPGKQTSQSLYFPPPQDFILPPRATQTCLNSKPDRTAPLLQSPSGARPCFLLLPQLPAAPPSSTTGGSSEHHSHPPPFPATWVLLPPRTLQPAFSVR